MDVLAALLDGPRAHGAFLLRSVLVAPWALRVEDRAPLTVMAVVRGEAWVQSDGVEVVRAPAGSVVLLRGPEPYEIADRPGRRPQALIHADQTCTSVDGGDLHWLSGTGVRTWGNAEPSESGAAGESVMLTGTYTEVGEVGRGLLSALPPLVLLADGEVDRTVVDLLSAETIRHRPGQEAVLDRMLDLLLVSGLRTWLDRGAGQHVGWYAGWSDPTVGRVLQLMQHQPDQAWTLDGLATAVGMSRAGLARRFKQLVGRSPMGFLTEWRLDLAADLLVSGDTTLEQIARRVGYANAFALSTAFRRERGVSPRAYRTRHRAGDPAVPIDAGFRPRDNG